MTVTIDGTKGTTTPGLYSNSTFTGTYADGIVADYTTGLGRISVGSSDGVAFYNGGVATTELMRLDSSGNLGIGTSSPTAKLTLQNGTITQQISTAPASSGTVIGAVTFNSDNSYGSFINAAAINAISLSNWGVSRESGLTFSTLANSVYAEKMRLDNNGNLLVGATTLYNVEKMGVTFNGSTQSGITVNDSAGVSTNVMIFRNVGTAVGTITKTTTATAYNTSSDYRLKDITGPVTGAKEFIMALQPKQGTWKLDGSRFVGFVAHEFQEVSPLSVTGEKDAVDENGEPIYQAMQASSPEVMANMISLIQEQQAMIEQLKADVAALKGAAA